MRCARSPGVWSGAALGFSGSSDRQGLWPWQPLISSRSHDWTPEAQPAESNLLGCRVASLRAGRRRTGRVDEELMLTPENAWPSRPWRMACRMATHGNSRQVFAG